MVQALVRLDIHLPECSAVEPIFQRGDPKLTPDRDQSVGREDCDSEFPSSLSFFERMTIGNDVPSDGEKGCDC